MKRLIIAGIIFLWVFFLAAPGSWAQNIKAVSTPTPTPTPISIAWIPETSSPAFSSRYRHTSVVFNNRMWVIAGSQIRAPYGPVNDVWYSTDGVNWSRATGNAGFPARTGHASVVFDGKLWVIGGKNN